MRIKIYFQRAAYADPQKYCLMQTLNSALGDAELDQNIASNTAQKCCPRKLLRYTAKKCCPRKLLRYTAQNTAKYTAKNTAQIYCQKYWLVQTGENTLSGPSLAFAMRRWWILQLVLKHIYCTRSQ